MTDHQGKGHSQSGDVKTQRNKTVDLLKALAIILVVIGHCIQYGSGAEYFSTAAYFDNLVFKIIYSFHMPLFMLISGFLFAFSINKYDWKQNIKNKIRQLLIPIFCWSVLSLLVQVIISRAIPSNVMQSFLDTFIHSLWFLWAILICSVLVLIGHELFQDSVWFYSLIVAASLFVPDRFGVELYKFMYPYFVVGFFANKAGWLQKALHTERHNWMLLMCLFLYVVLMLFYSRDSYIYTSGHTLLHKSIGKQLVIDCFRYIVGFVGSVLVTLVVWGITEKSDSLLQTTLCAVGKRSLGIYAVSEVLFRFVVRPLTQNFIGCRFTTLLLETAVVLLVSYGITILIQQFKGTNLLLLGGRITSPLEGTYERSDRK